jgi:hypothetical protein
MIMFVAENQLTLKSFCPVIYILVLEGEETTWM